MATRREVLEAELKVVSRLDEHGREVLSSEKLALPLGYKKPESLAEQIQRLVVRQLSDQAQAEGFDSFEESEDFDIGDDPPDPSSPYEEFFDPVLGRGITHEEFRQNWPIYRERFLKAEMAAYEQMDRSDALRRPFREPPPAEQSGPQAGQVEKPPGKV